MFVRFSTFGEGKIFKTLKMNLSDLTGLKS
jgi:hypothetical protein